MQSEIELNVEEIIENLYRYYGVYSNIDLAQKMEVSPQTITNWKGRDSIKAIKKQCRKLGVYEKIFTEQIKKTLNDTLVVAHVNDEIDIIVDQLRLAYDFDELKLELNRLFFKRVTEKLSMLDDFVLMNSVLKVIKNKPQPYLLLLNILEIVEVGYKQLSDKTIVSYKDFLMKTILEDNSIKISKSLKKELMKDIKVFFDEDTCMTFVLHSKYLYAILYTTIHPSCLAKPNLK